MKTTIDIPDGLYRRVKSLAAQRGQTVKSFVLEALQQKLAAKEASPSCERGWRVVFGKAPAKPVDDLQRQLDEEYSAIRPEDWR